MTVYGGKQAENRPSALLTLAEWHAVVGLVGPRCQTLATTVVQASGRAGGPA
jgi:hypothetical protein